MAMVCPQCSKVYEQQERQCDDCNVPLLFYAQLGSASSSSGGIDDGNPQWQQTPWGKIFAGLVLSIGLMLGLRQMVTAWFKAQGDDTLAGIWSTLEGLAILHGLSAIGLLAGGMLAGAGQFRAMLFGSLVGLGNGFVFLFREPGASAVLPEWGVYAQPFVHLVVGALGGLIGKVIWRPTPVVALPEGNGSDLPLPAAFEMRWLQGPIHWWRMSAGATLVVCGVIWSQMILKWMIDYTQGALNITTHFQARIVSWEISGLAILIGSLFAGATTYNGAKQGLCVGIGASIMFVGFQLANPTALLETTIINIVTMVSLALLGGWFGGQLFPPLGLAPRRRRIIDI